MKGSRILLTLYCFSALSLFGVVERIDPEDLKKMKGGLKEFHKPTESGDYISKPDVSKFEESTLLVAKMDFFGLDRYFTFETNEDVNQLVQSAKNGGGLGVSWYSLIKYRKTENMLEPFLLISHILPGSQANKSRSLVPGDIIKSVNGTPVKTVGELREALRAGSHSEFLSITTADDVLAVFPLKAMLREPLGIHCQTRYGKVDLLYRSKQQPFPFVQE